MGKEYDFYHFVKIIAVPQLKIGNISYRKMFYFDEKLSASEIDISFEKKGELFTRPKIAWRLFAKKALTR